MCIRDRLDTVKGKGKVGEPRLGTHTWPELNSAILTVIPDDQLYNVITAINKIDKINEEVGIKAFAWDILMLSLIHISEPTRLLSISYAVFCLKKKKKEKE